MGKTSRIRTHTGTTIAARTGRDYASVPCTISAMMYCMEEYLDNNCVTSEQIDNIAPILKPDQVDTIVEKTPIHNLGEIADLLPFISRNIVNQLARKAAEECNYRDLSEVAPFVDRNVINEIADKMLSEGQSIDDVAPFVSREMISKLAQVRYEEHGLSSLDEDRVR